MDIRMIMEWNGMECNGMEWNGMEWNHNEWNVIMRNVMEESRRMKKSNPKKLKWFFDE